MVAGGCTRIAGLRWRRTSRLARLAEELGRGRATAGDPVSEPFSTFFLDVSGRKVAGVMLLAGGGLFTFGGRPG